MLGIAADLEVFFLAFEGSRRIILQHRLMHLHQIQLIVKFCTMLLPIDNVEPSIRRSFNTFASSGRLFLAALFLLQSLFNRLILAIAAIFYRPEIGLSDGCVVCGALFVC